VEDTDDPGLGPFDVDAFKRFKSNPSKNLQPKNSKIYEVTTGCAFIMSAIRYNNEIYPIAGTLTARSGTGDLFQKVEFDPPIEHGGHYIKCEILLTGPIFQRWSAEQMLFFDPTIPNFGQAPLQEGYFARYEDPIS
jgi:hypothetical protein